MGGGRVPSIPCGNAVNQLFNGGYQAVFVKGIRCKAIGVVAGEHQLILGLAAVGDVLQGFLNAKGSGICPFACGALFVLGPVAKGAGTQAAHTVDLIFVDGG